MASRQQTINELVWKLGKKLPEKVVAEIKPTKKERRKATKHAINKLKKFLQKQNKK